MIVTAWPFIVLDDFGSPLIQAHAFKVLHLVREHLAFDWDAEQLHRQHPQLALPEIHAALGYYYEHQSECDLMLEREERRLDDLKAQLINQKLQEQLRLARTQA